MMRITVLGAGSWGTTLAVLLHQKHHHVTLWAHRPAHADEIRSAIEQARAHDGVTVIHVAVSPTKRAPGYDTWWDVPVAAVSGSDLVNTARAKYEDKLTKQRAELL